MRMIPGLALYNKLCLINSGKMFNLCTFNQGTIFGYIDYQRTQEMKEFVRKHIVSIIFSFAGTIAGFLYWKFIGCSSGTCPIRSVWYLMTLYGLLLGWVTGGLAEDIFIKLFRKS